MTLKADSEAVLDMVAKCEGECLWSDHDAVRRIIALAERVANPALPALLEACEAVRLGRRVDGAPSLHPADEAGLPRAIGYWRAAKAEGFEA